MAIVFVRCVGNNGGVTYRYNNPTQTLTYIPASSSYNVFLYDESNNNSLIALDPILQTQTMIFEFISQGDNEWFIPFANAYKYQWSVSSIRYKDHSSSGWGSWNTYSGSKTLQVVSNCPEAIRVYIPGTSGLASGERLFELTLTAVPRKSYSFPESIT